MSAGRVFLAGASGVIGRALVPLLVDAGWDVTGTTRDPAKRDPLAALCAVPAVVDAYDAAALARAVAEARPNVIVNQMTDLSAMDLAANARLRRAGGANLAAAARAAGVPRMIAQSILWIYAPGPEPHGEDDPLDTAATDGRGDMIDGTRTLERLTLRTPGVRGTVLRYGHLYGPGTGRDASPEPPRVSVDGAARAALLAVERDVFGVFNVAEPSAYADTSRAARLLDWHA